MLTVLRQLALHGRFALVAGLLAGLLLPGVAAVLKPWLAHLVVVLLVLTAVRIGPREALRGVSDIRKTIATVVVLQLGAPLVALAVFGLFGVLGSPYAMAVVLVLAAPALTGSPNLSIMLSADPEPAFRLLILGTAMLPLTMLPVFWLSPQLGDFSQALWGAFRVFAAMTVAVLLGFLLRTLLAPRLEAHQTEAVDGLMTVALVVVVVGLMGALGPALLRSPLNALGWFALACAVNLGMQGLVFRALRSAGQPRGAVPVSIVAGNRNVALFLITMSPAQAEPLMIFLGCYQVPMYLTPILMRRWYGADIG